ncbi:MAG: glutaminyl-peptide cyclotransferase [Bacteroidales bacterium]|nr:glutaminyl-peptide cyclotransferase [Bacteroidales bacterium]
MNYFKLFLSFSILAIITLSSCKSEDKKKNNNIKDNSNIQKVENPLILNVETDKKNTIGDIINISIKGSKIDDNDTVILYINKKEAAKLDVGNNEYEWNSASYKVGENNIEIELNKNNKRFRKQKNIVLLSDITPENYTYKIKNVYKHDVNAYTQGLFFYDGFLYEATGLKGESTIRKVKLETGEVLHSFTIPKDIFGEGIVLFDNKIIQLSWEAERGFVYDFETFKLLDEFSYFGEGWGICTDNSKLYMTNGSADIAVLETQSYSEIDRLQAYDNKGQVKYLNELEYINGFIYANIYQYEKIAKINPANGKVTAYIDLTGILPMNDYNNKTDVLNGIAYDSKTDRIFVTGKKWPKLFEIELIKK